MTRASTTKVRLVLGAVCVPLLLGIGATVGSADANLTNVPAHRHWIGTAWTGPQIGPKLCDNANLQNAFNQFHNNAHVAGASSQGPAAPGLHNGKGGEIVASPCIRPVLP